METPGNRKSKRFCGDRGEGTGNERFIDVSIIKRKKPALQKVSTRNCQSPKLFRDKQRRGKISSGTRNVRRTRTATYPLSSLLPPSARKSLRPYSFDDKETRVINYPTARLLCRKIVVSSRSKGGWPGRVSLVPVDASVW